MYNRITWLYTQNCHNIVNQPQSNIKENFFKRATSNVLAPHSLSATWLHPRTHRFLCHPIPPALDESSFFLQPQSTLAASLWHHFQNSVQPAFSFGLFCSPAACRLYLFGSFTSIPGMQGAVQKDHPIVQVRAAKSMASQLRQALHAAFLSLAEFPIPFS